MENFSDLIAKRRSMRKFTDEQLTPDEVKLLLRSALICPTSKRSTCWEFVVVDDKEQLKRLSECKDAGAGFIADAVLAVVVLGNPEVSDVWIEDASIAAITMQYQAEDLGLGSCWAQVRQRFDASGNPAEEDVREILGIPANYQPLCIIGFGHKGMERKMFNEDNLQWEKVHIDRF